MAKCGMTFNFYRNFARDFPVWAEIEQIGHDGVFLTG